MKTTLTCPANRLYTLVMDPAEIFPDDPGAGTPLMVYGPKESGATYDCASITGWLNEGESNAVELSDAVMRWLNSDAVDTAIADFWEANG